jgi:hypothetical protein
MTGSQRHLDYPSIREQRGVAFERVRRVFRWTTAGAVTAVALIVGVVEHQIPGRSSSSATTANGSPVTTTPSATASSTSGNSSASNASGSSGAAVKAPTKAPTPTQRTPIAVSGGTSW